MWICVEHKIITCQLTSKPDPLAVSERGKICLQIQETGAEKKRVQSLLLTVPCGKGADAVFQSTSGVWIRTEDSERWECGQDRMREEKSVDTPAFFFIDSMEANGDPMELLAVFQNTGDVSKEQGSAKIFWRRGCKGGYDLYFAGDEALGIFGLSVQGAGAGNGRFRFGSVKESVPVCPGQKGDHSYGRPSHFSNIPSKCYDLSVHFVPLGKGCGNLAKRREKNAGLQAADGDGCALRQ